MGVAGWIIVGIIVMAVLWAIMTYNGLVSLRQRCRQAFSDIDVQLKQRHDLIPNLVETVKGYASHEKGTLEAVIKARNAAVAAQGPSAQAAAEGALQGALRQLLVLSEAYPDLKANQNMMQVSEELTSTENKVAFARQAYNDAVMYYNNRREVFPNSFVANMYNFTPATPLEIESPEARKAVKVSFT
jgi:LemA protein